MGECACTGPGGCRGTRGCCGLRGLRHLAELDLGSNQLYHLPAWITELTTLRVLLLRSLSHRHAPRALDAEQHVLASALPNLSGLTLVELDLSDTDLWDCTLPAWLWTMDTLESLDLSDNHLTCLPPGAGLLVRLTTLSLHQQIPWGGSEENLVLDGGGAEALQGTQAQRKDGEGVGESTVAGDGSADLSKSRAPKSVAPTSVAPASVAPKEGSASQSLVMGSAAKSSTFSNE